MRAIMPLRHHLQLRVPVEREEEEAQECRTAWNEDNHLGFIMSYSLQGARMTSSGRDMRSTMAIFTCCKILCRSVTDLGEMDADGKSIFTEKMSRACFVLFFFCTSLQGNGCRPLVLISSSLHVRHANWLCIKKKRKNVWPRVAFLTNF